MPPSIWRGPGVHPRLGCLTLISWGALATCNRRSAQRAYLEYRGVGSDSWGLSGSWWQQQRFVVPSAETSQQPLGEAPPVTCHWPELGHLSIPESLTGTWNGAVPTTSTSQELPWSRGHRPELHGGQVAFLNRIRAQTRRSRQVPRGCLPCVLTLHPPFRMPRHRPGPGSSPSLPHCPAHEMATLGVSGSHFPFFLGI